MVLASREHCLVREVPSTNLHLHATLLLSCSTDAPTPGLLSDCQCAGGAWWFWLDAVAASNVKVTLVQVSKLANSAGMLQQVTAQHIASQPSRSTQLHASQASLVPGLG